jgi:hypothetical protein
MEHTIMATKKVTARRDLNVLAMKQTAIVTLYAPNDPSVDTGFRIEIASMYSDEARDAVRNISKPLALVDGEAHEPTFTDSLFEQTVAVTKRWWVEGEPYETIVLDGVELEPTPENVRAVYSDPRYVWIQREVQAAYLELGRFFGASKAS